MECLLWDIKKSHSSQLVQPQDYCKWAFADQCLAMLQLVNTLLVSIQMGHFWKSALSTLKQGMKNVGLLLTRQWCWSLCHLRTVPLPNCMYLPWHASLLSLNSHICFIPTMTCPFKLALSNFHFFMHMKKWFSSL